MLGVLGEFISRGHFVVDSFARYTADAESEALVSAWLNARINDRIQAALGNVELDAVGADLDTMDQGSDRFVLVRRLTKSVRHERSPPEFAGTALARPRRRTRGPNAVAYAVRERGRSRGADRRLRS